MLIFEIKHFIFILIQFFLIHNILIAVAQVFNVKEQFPRGYSLINLCMQIFFMMAALKCSQTLLLIAVDLNNSRI